MATNTENYGFRKVGLDAAADIEVIEENWDLADAALKVIDVRSEQNAFLLEGVTQKNAELEEEIAEKASASHTHLSADITSLVASKISAGTFSATGVMAKSGTDYSTARVRNIKAGTADLTAGTSALTSGDIYFVYE